MVLVTPAEQEEHVAFLTRLATGSADPTTRAQASAELLKWGFNPAEPRGVGGRWSTTSETPQRRAKERRVKDVQQRLDDANQANRLSRELATKPTVGTKFDSAAARKQYGIPTGRTFSHLSAAKKAAARQILAAAAALHRLKARQGDLAARVAKFNEELGRSDLTDKNRSRLQSQLAHVTQLSAAVGARIDAANHMLAAGKNAWHSKKNAEVDLVKGDVKPGQRYRHGWIPITADLKELPDTLGLTGPREGGQSRTFFASDRIASHHGNPVNINIHQWDDSDDLNIDVDTHPPTTTHEYTDGSGTFEMGYTGATLDHEGAARAADHLHDLVAIGRSGVKTPAPGKKTKHQRAAEMLDHWMSGGSTDPGDKILDGSGSEELPLTYKDLRELLAARLPAPTADDKRLAPRRVNRYSDDTDGGDLFMRLDTTGDQPVVQVTGRERESTPWDPTGGDAHQTSHLTLDQAEELAHKLGLYAEAATPRNDEG